jgi:hypothetical protein
MGAFFCRCCCDLFFVGSRGLLVVQFFRLVMSNSLEQVGVARPWIYVLIDYRLLLT